MGKDLSRVVITGASGFVGTALCRSMISDGVDVVALVRASSDVRELAAIEAIRVETIPTKSDDLRSLLEGIQPEVVFHLATYYSRRDDVDVSHMIDTNIGLGTRILSAVASLETAQSRIVLAGSFFQHLRESQALNLYSATKSAFRLIIEYYADAYGLCYAEVVLSDVYGPGARRRKLIDAAIGAAVSGEEIQLPRETALVQLIYVDDAVTALKRAATALLASDENCGAQWFASPPSAMTIDEVLAVVERVVGRPINRSDKSLDLPARRMGHLVTGTPPPDWIPLVDLESGIARMVADED